MAGFIIKLALLGFVVVFPVVQPFMLGTLKTVIGAHLLGGLGSSGNSGSSENQRSSIGFYVNRESGQSSYDGLPAFPMPASHSAKDHTPSPVYATPGYTSGNVPIYNYLTPQYGNPLSFPNYIGGHQQPRSVPEILNGNALPVYSNPFYSYFASPRQHDAALFPANGADPSVYGNTYPLSVYSPFPGNLMQGLPAYGVSPIAVPATPYTTVGNVMSSIPSTGAIPEVPAGGAMDLNTLLRLAQTTGSLPGATVKANMGAAASVNASIGRMNGARVGRQEELPVIPEETLQRYFEFLSEIDQDSCLSRLVCEVTADAHAFGVYGRLYGRMISNFFLTREENSNSFATPFVQAAKLGQQNGMQGCAASYGNCTLDLPQIIKSVRL